MRVRNRHGIEGLVSTSSLSARSVSIVERYRAGLSSIEGVEHRHGLAAKIPGRYAQARPMPAISFGKRVGFVGRSAKSSFERADFRCYGESARTRTKRDGPLDHEPNACGYLVNRVTCAGRLFQA